MSSASINYNLLLASAPNLETGAESVKGKIKDLPDIRESIEAHGKNHDNCFGSISDDIEYSLNNVIGKTEKLAVDMITTVNLFSQAELASVKDINITSKGIDSAIKSQFEKTYQKDLAGYDYDYYQSLFNKTMALSSDERTKSVMAALFLATSFPHMNYFWGGGHDKISEGLDPTWGQPKVVTAGGSETTGTKVPNSLDCSGYVSWALKNGGYDMKGPMTTIGLEKIGEKIPITDAVKNDIQVGDLAYQDGHIGMIVRVDGSEITISHCSGSGGGMNITKMDTKTGLITEDWNKQVNRVGEPYFTDIIKMNYNTETGEK